MKHFLILFVLIPKLLSNDKLHGESVEVSNLLPENEVVTLTTYVPNVRETDSTPHITASGFKISKKNPKKHRIIAVSRDLKRKLKFGQRVRLKNAGKYSGEYVVRDVMNKRFRKRVDILVNSKDKPTKLDNVQISLVK